MSRPPQPKGKNGNNTSSSSKANTNAANKNANTITTTDDDSSLISNSTGAPRPPTMDEVSNNILHAVVTKPSERTMQKYESKIKELFKYFDASASTKEESKKNSCDVRDVGALVRGLNLTPNEVTVLKIIEDCEEEESTGYIKFEKLFPVLMKCLVNREYAGQILEREDELMLKRAFSALDKEGKGWIDAEVLKGTMMKKPNDGGGSEPLSAEEVEKMFEAIVDPETGKVNIDDYISLLMEQ